jgi:membrane fusion protein
MGDAAQPDLFRSEVRDEHTHRTFGKVLLIHPVSHYFLLISALLFLTVLICFLIFGQYTRHVSVMGVLEPDQGVIKIYAPQAGTLTRGYVQEGQRVRKGDVLLVFSSEHQGANGGVVEADLEIRLQERLATLHQELQGAVELHDTEKISAQENLTALLNSRNSLRMQMQIQQTRAASAQQTAERFESLRESGFMSALQAQQKRDELIDQKIRIQELQTNLVNIEADIDRARHELKKSPLRKEIAKAQLARNISSIETELSQQKNGHEWSIIAPCDGTVSSLTVAHHQTATAGIPIITVVPQASQLEAKLYAPSRALGFMETGQIVKIKLEAFPYQKFGLANGSISAIADSPVSSTEIAPGTRIAVTEETHEPMYAIRVKLNQQFIHAYGKQQPLRPGMQLIADVELDTRKLYEWVLEPLYSMRRS